MPYFWWANKTGPTSSIKRIRCLEHPPRPSDLTANDRISRILAACEAVGDVLLAGNPEDYEAFKADVVSALQDAASEIQTVGEEYGESYDSMGEGLQQTDAGQRCEEMRDNCDDWSNSIMNAADDIEAMEEEKEEPEEGEESVSSTPDVQGIIDAAEEALSVVEV